MTSAPSSCARASLSACRDVTTVRAPNAFAICKPASDTPPPMPTMSTVSQGLICVFVTSMRHAVRWLTPTAAPSANDQPAGSGKTLRAGALTYSAKVPLRCSPSTW